MRSVVVIFCTLASLIVVSNAAAYIIHVPGDYPFIQEGIDHAWSGDTVLVAPGAYYEHINFSGKAILVASEAGAESTIIDKDHSGESIVTFASGEDSMSILDGFTIQNGFAEKGGGIYIGSGTAGVVRNCEIKYCQASSWGGGICCENSSFPRIYQNRIIENQADFGGGIHCENASGPLIESNLVLDNTAYSLGGGVYVYASGSSLLIVRNLIAGNTAGSSSGGLRLAYCDGVLDHNTISYNTGGVRCDYGVAPTIKNNIISDSPSGFGIIGTSPIISYNDVWNNAEGDYSGCVPGEGCISVDPMFCDPEGGDYHLQTLSPCLGAGEGGSDMGAFGGECGHDVVSAGPDQTGPANTDVMVTFYLHNDFDSTVTFDLHAYDTLGWSIFPEQWETTLAADEHDSAVLTVSVPDVMTGTRNRIYVTAASPPDSLLDAAFLTVTVSPRTIHVPYDRPTIQTGIDASGPDDTVLVASDIYYEHVFFNGKQVLVKSEKGRDSTTISKIAGGVSMVSFIFGEDSNSVLDGFTITGGTLESGEGAGIRCEGSSPRILNNRIVDNSSPYGAGIACDSNSSPLIAGNLIEENAASWFGGGVYCFDNSSPVMRQNVFSQNSAGQQGGGVYCQSSCSPIITENMITGNTAGMSGGGLCFTGTSSPTITGNLISNNTAQTNSGGGIAVLTMSQAMITDNTIDGNSAVLGGGIYLDLTSSASIVNTIVSNTPAGKGIRNAGDYPTIIFCDVWNNLDENYYGCFPGEGCMSEDPLFCYPGNDDYSLWFTSPCLGTGQDGSDIGAFGEGCSSVGDANGDGEINIGDVVYVVNYLYKGGPPPVPLLAGDANGDGAVDVGDVVYLVNYLYKGGPPPCEPRP